MIAANFRKYPEAQLLQLELDLAGVVGACRTQRDAAHKWLMNAITVITLPKPNTPAWFAAFRRRATSLAKKVREALRRLF